jgi:hypothetical protein
MRIHFLTFCNKSFGTTELIAKEAKEFGIFDEISEYTDDTIKDFVNEHKDFIEKNKTGFGCFIWKPKIIYDKLQTMEENDILLYADVKTHLNIQGKPRMLNYLQMISEEKPLLVFGTSPNYLIQTYAFKDAVKTYYPEMKNDENHITCYAGLFFIKKTPASLKFIEDWLALCTNYHFLKGIDFDNGLFGICLLKHKIHKMVYPDECNCYEHGWQMIHRGISPSEMPWHLLHDKPFHIRRFK